MNKAKLKIEIISVHGYFRHHSNCPMMNYQTTNFHRSLKNLMKVKTMKTNLLTNYQTMNFLIVYFRFHWNKYPSDQNSDQLWGGYNYILPSLSYLVLCCCFHLHNFHFYVDERKYQCLCY